MINKDNEQQTTKRKGYSRKEEINLTEEPTALKIRPYKLKELAKLYGTCGKTLKKWIEPYKDEIGPRIGYFYTINQVGIIFKNLNPPSFLNIE
jgi:hypothetical protein